MFSFFGNRNKDSNKKSSSEGGTDGFVIIGETVEEQRQKIQNVNISKPSCNVIVQPSKCDTYPGPPLSSPCSTSRDRAITRAYVEAPGAHRGGPPSLPELLGDVPFTLAPHVLAKQTGGPGFPLFSEMLMSPQDINHNLASFSYDFTLENSVLCDH